MPAEELSAWLADRTAGRAGCPAPALVHAGR
jgi:hypothetical protein